LSLPDYTTEVIKMLYCPPNATLDKVWINHGLNICWMETVTSSIVGLFILLFGTLQLSLYKRYATHLSDITVPKNRLFKAQVGFHFVLPAIALIVFTLRHVGLGGGDGKMSRDRLSFDLGGQDESPVYGYEILSLLSSCVVWPMSLGVLYVERWYQLPTSPSHGHGVVLLLTWTGCFVAENLAFLSMDNQQWWFHLDTYRHKMEFGCWVARYAATFFLFILGIKAPGISAVSAYYSRYSEEARERLNGSGDASDPTMTADGAHVSASVGSTWRNVGKKLRKLLPYMWPRRHRMLQLRVLVCVLILVGVRVINVYVPILSKQIIDKLAETDPAWPWALIVLFVFMKMLQGGGTGSQGLLNGLRSFLWIRVQQFTAREITVEMFAHLHRLSLRWHLSRKTGEVLRIMDRGTSSINSLLSYIVFNIAPTIIDILVAIVYFTAEFNAWFGLLVFITMLLYLSVTVAMTEWRTKYRRKMNEADNKQRQRAVDSLLNFETVKYFANERHEADQLKEAVQEYQEEEWKTLASLNLLNVVQCVVINGGLMIGSVYAAWLVHKKEKTVGDYVLFGSYIMQLMVPLNWMGTLYRVIQESFVNMENMFDLMAEKIEVEDAPNALPLMPLKGKIDFRNVSFTYNSESESQAAKPVLKGINLTVEAGQTVAIVGPTGAGKTTLMRLLFRFYDPTEGEVFFDNQNIRFVTQESLRKAIGVVPQDTTLFNDTIGMNIGYGRLDAGMDEICDAARQAEIHTRITEMSDGYDTVVGERGLKLSGGEKQRVAIARAALKAPLVVLLDEATSALDSNTEQSILNAFKTNVCSGKTTIAIAHRLSTIKHADLIVVLKDGTIAEQGTHEELIGMGPETGVYASMWKTQSQESVKQAAKAGTASQEMPAAVEK